MNQILEIFSYTSVQEWLVSSGIQIALIIVISVIFHFAFKGLVNNLLRLSMKSNLHGRSKAGMEKRMQTLSQVFSKTSGIIISLIALMMIMIEFGINVTPILTGAGIVGIAVGFGAQDSVKNLFHGIFILLEDQFSEGDVVTVAGVTGRVEGFDLRRTVLRDLDGTQYHIPNGEITVASNKTKNWSGINMELGVSYDSDLKEVRDVINEVGKKLKKNFPDDVTEQPIVAGVEEFADSAIIIKVLGRVAPGKQWEISRVFREDIKIAFDKANIEIPYPHRVELQKKI